MIKVGDLVTRSEDEEHIIFEVKSILTKGDKEYARLETTDGCIAVTSPVIADNIRRATKEDFEKRRDFLLWEDNGRRVWRLLVGDILIKRERDQSDNVLFVVDQYEYQVALSDGVNIKYVGDSRELHEEYEVACFVRDRVDKANHPERESIIDRSSEERVCLNSLF